MNAAEEVRSRIRCLKKIDCSLESRVGDFLYPRKEFSAFELMTGMRLNIDANWLDLAFEQFGQFLIPA